MAAEIEKSIVVQVAWPSSSLVTQGGSFYWSQAAREGGLWSWSFV